MVRNCNICSPITIAYIFLEVNIDISANLKVKVNNSNNFQNVTVPVNEQLANGMHSVLVDEGIIHHTVPSPVNNHNSS